MICWPWWERASAIFLTTLLSSRARPPDNGAYYYYNTEVGKNMQQTVVDALKYWDSLSLPYQHVMYDSCVYWPPALPLASCVSPPHLFVSLP